MKKVNNKKNQRAKLVEEIVNNYQETFTKLREYDMAHEHGMRVELKPSNPKDEGVKHDSEKVRLDLLPPELLFAVGEVLTFGAKKYSARNWEKGMSWGRVFGALMRHMWAWWGGKLPTNENFVFGCLDPETKFSHLWHAGCCIAFLITYEQRKIGTDDRGI